ARRPHQALVADRAAMREAEDRLEMAAQAQLAEGARAVGVRVRRDDIQQTHDAPFASLFWLAYRKEHATVHSPRFFVNEFTDRKPAAATARTVPGRGPHQRGLLAP